MKRVISSFKNNQMWLKCFIFEHLKLQVSKCQKKVSVTKCCKESKCHKVSENIKKCQKES